MELKELLTKLKSYYEPEDEEPEDFDLWDACAGQIDDAYNMGIETGEQYMAKAVYDLIVEYEKNNSDL